MSLLRKQRRIVGRWIVGLGRSLKNILFGKVELPTSDKIPHRILIIRPFFLGDILLCLPLAQAIKQKMPDAHITWLLREEWTELIAHHSVVDEVIPFSASKMNSLKIAGEFFRVARELQKRSFDWVFNLSWDRSSILWSWLSGADVQIGIEEYGRPRLFSLLQTQMVIAPERSKDCRSMADFYYDPLCLLGFGFRTETPHIFATEHERAVVNLRTQDALGGKNSWILLHPGGRLSCKRWPPEQFADFLRQLSQYTPHPIILTCGPDEKEWTAQLVSSLPPGRSLFWPGPSFGELIAMAERATLFIGNDSGPMHLAAATGCRVVALFGNDPVRWAPLGKDHSIIYEKEGLHYLRAGKVLEVVLSVLCKESLTRLSY